MADVLPDLTLIVTNPDLSGRSLKVMTLARHSDGSLAVDPAYPDVSIGDGQTTLIRVPLGARMVISEGHEPPMPAVVVAAISDKPAITPAPAAEHAEGGFIPAATA